MTKVIEELAEGQRQHYAELLDSFRAQLERESLEECVKESMIAQVREYLDRDLARWIAECDRHLGDAPAQADDPIH